MKKIIILGLIFSQLGLTPLWADSDSHAFFDQLKQHCGKTYFGKSVYPLPAETPFDQKLTMHVAECSDKQIKIPFKVGQDTSRTWVISKHGDRLLFKHDHRHEDGTPHELTLYGGLSDGNGDKWSQSFPADKATHKLVPAGKTNVWTLTIEPQNNQFIYYLTRHGKPRYKAEFDLKE